MRTIFPILILAGILAGCGEKDTKSDSVELVMFCAAGMKDPVTQIAEQYQKEFGIKVQLQFAGSGTLLGSMEVAAPDIYLAADSSYTDIAREKDLIAETMLVAWMKAGLGVPKGNPKKLTALADIKQEGLRVGIGNPEAASVGKFTKKVLTKNGIWKGFKSTVTFPTVNELANAVKLGTLDTVILWDAIAHQYPDVDFISLPEFDVEKKDITIAVTKACKQPTEALKFCRYLTARDRGLVVFHDEGFEVSTGDYWVEEPDILLYSGAMLRPAIQESIKAFEKREGVKINPVYNGCGILVSQMKAGEQPDAYFSCDKKFMDQVQNRFEQSTTVSANEMVIIAEKDNPKKILLLDDLFRPGLRLGLAHPEKSALGFLTKDMLEKVGIYQKIVDSGNLKMTSPTGDFLVNQIKAGSLDAVIVYRSNALATASTADKLTVLGIERPEAIATQPYAVANNSKHGRLMSRFLDTCITGEGKDAFMKFGFRWELKDSAAERRKRRGIPTGSVK